MFFLLKSLFKNPFSWFYLKLKWYLCNLFYFQSMVNIHKSDLYPNINYVRSNSELDNFGGSLSIIFRTMGWVWVENLFDFFLEFDIFKPSFFFSRLYKRATSYKVCQKILGEVLGSLCFEKRMWCFVPLLSHDQYTLIIKHFYLLFFFGYVESLCCHGLFSQLWPARAMLWS